MTRPPSPVRADAPGIDVDGLLADTDISILICCGSGGVGKTTTSAALALRAAEQGRRVVVLTIDPARRLAQSLGIAELDNTPRAVAGLDTSAGGSLDAMMLDMKRTFDDVVLAHASKDKAQQILTNPFYQALSTSFAGTQEYMAMEKLGQLHTEAVRTGRWDLIVVDTPPSRSALDFLDAPEHLSRLLDGRMLRMLLAPARGPFKLMTVGVNLVTSAMNKILGSQVLTDVQTFVTAFEALFGGFRQRAQATLANLSSEHTRFLVVAAPARDALREAAYFIDRLAEEEMPLCGLVVNRVHRATLELNAGRTQALIEQASPDAVWPNPVLPDPAGPQPAGPDTAGLGRAGPDPTGDEATRMGALALQLHLQRVQVIATERSRVNRFTQSHPDLPLLALPALGSDVTALTDLRALGELMAQN